MDKYAKKRDKLIDEMIRLKKEYFYCMEGDFWSEAQMKY